MSGEDDGEESSEQASDEGVSGEDDGEPLPDLDGTPLVDAVERALNRHPDRDRQRVRASLQRAAEDDLVTDDALAAALATGSKVLSTAETRTELARLALADARADAEPVADLRVVDARLDRFHDRVDALGEHVAELGPDLRDVLSLRADGRPIDAVALALDEVWRAATAIQQSADELQVEIESFADWLADAGRRRSQLSVDLDGIETYLDGVATLVDRIEDHREASAAAGAAADRSVAVALPGTDREASLRSAWLDARLRSGAAALLGADARAELAAAREIAERSDGGDAADAPGHDELGDRLATLDERRDALADRIGVLARREWAAAFAAHRGSVDEDPFDREPPLDWAAVEPALVRFRDRIHAADD